MKQIFTNKGIAAEYKNIFTFSILHIVEILLTTPFTNVKLEQVFSRMSKIKPLSKNCLGQERLETQMHVREEGIGIVRLDPEPHIKQWFEIRFEDWMRPNLESTLQDEAVQVQHWPVVMLWWTLHQPLSQIWRVVMRNLYF